MRASMDRLLRQLQNRGYKIHNFSVQSEGQYAVADADWNYKDVPHLNIVHTQVRTIIATIDDDLITTINLQKVAGIALPVALVNYASTGTSQTYYTTLGPYILIVHTEYFRLDENRTRVVTTYNIGAAGLWRIFFSLLERTIRGNYRRLMSEDLPMRDRRGELREKGFRFKSDGRTRTFPQTTDLIFENVVPPKRSRSRTERIPLERLGSNGDSVLIGSPDDRGLRVVRDGQNLLFFPRFCSHEGAAVDCSAVKSARLTCPWHAKKILPLATLPVSQQARAEFDPYAVQLENSHVLVTLPDGDPATTGGSEV